MRKLSLLLVAAFAIGFTASAQKISTKVIDNKGTIKWVIDSATQVITKADSTILYVTPTQLNGFINAADTSSMLSPYINAANNGLTKVGQTVELGGTLNHVTTINTTATNFLAITGLDAGDTGTDSILVVSPTGQVKSVAAADLIDALSYSNGLTKTGNNVKLGGALDTITTITTDATNVLKIAGLQSGNLSTDSLVVAGADGTLRKVNAANISLQSGDENFAASLHQATYTVTSLPAVVSRVWVYRNGAKLVANTDYTVSGSDVTLSGTMAGLVEVGDIVEVQWVK